MHLVCRLGSRRFFIISRKEDAMGESVPVHNETYDAEVVRLPVEIVSLREINDASIGDVELEQLINAAIERKDVLDQEEESRARYILKRVLESLGVTGEMSTFFDENNVPKSDRKADMRHTAQIDHRIKDAQTWYAWHSEQFGRRETGDKLIEDIELINEDWPPTNFYRAFKILAEKIKINHKDQFANAVIQANRLAVIMMAQATSGYTKTSE